MLMQGLFCQVFFSHTDDFAIVELSEDRNSRSSMQFTGEEPQHCHLSE